MPIHGAKIERMTRDGAYGTATPLARVQLDNLSASPYGPLRQRRTRETRASSTGDFFCPVPVGREGDVVRLIVGDQTSRSGAVRQLLKLRGLAASDGRRPEVEVQGLRLVRGSDGLTRFVNVRQNPTVGEPGATLRFTNQRTGVEVDLVLDDDGCIPAGATLEAERDDLFVIAASDGEHNKDLSQRWASLCVTDPAQPVDEPSLKLGDQARGPGLVSVNGPLAVDGIDADDPLQGALGDCWLVATVSAIAHCRKELLAEMVKPLADGRFAVTFKRWDAGAQAYVDHVEPVTPRLPRSSYSGLAYGRSRNSRDPNRVELWWPLIEKAYAQWKGSYDAASCGYPYAAFEALLGREGEHVDFDELEADALFGVLQQAEQDRAPVVLCTRAKEEWPATGGAGLIKDHAYTLLGVREENGVRSVRLRNPWGQEEPGHDGKNDGIFELPIAGLRELFCWASIGR